jgi:hypothetical protein
MILSTVVKRHSVTTLIFPSWLPLTKKRIHKFFDRWQFVSQSLQKEIPSFGDQDLKQINQLKFLHFELIFFLIKKKSFVKWRLRIEFKLNNTINCKSLKFSKNVEMYGTYSTLQKSTLTFTIVARWTYLKPKSNS